MERSPTPPLFAWLNVLSLDAPAIALVWQELFARVFGVSLRPVERVILALAVWLAYMADRWLDGRGLTPGGPATHRHRFARRHQRTLFILWMLVFVAAVALSWKVLPVVWLLIGGGLVAGIVLHLWLNHQQRRWSFLQGFKESAVALLFATGTIFFIALKAPSTGQLWGGALLWAGLVFINCVFIAAWEKDRDRAQKQSSIITRWPALETHLLKPAYALAAVATLIALGLRGTPLSQIAAPVVTSTLLLIVIARGGEAVQLDKRRLLADLALLTPLLWWARFPAS